MKTLQRIGTILRRPVIIVAILAAQLSTPVIFTAVSHALPLHYFASAPVGQTCTLPDGQQGHVIAYSTAGGLGSAGTTCCPDYAKDNISCLYAKYINPFITVLSVLVGLAVVIAIIIGGIEVLTSAADPQRVAAGRKRIIGALVALVAYFVLYAALQFLLPGGVFNNG